MNPKQKKLLTRIIVALVLFVIIAIQRMEFKEL